MKLREEPEQVLVVDLDDTVLRTDMLFESLAHLLRNHPIRIIFIPAILLFKGRAGLKKYLSAQYEYDPKLLPYRDEVIHFIKAERQHGVRTVLATATDETIAGRIATHLGIFDEVHASTQECNLKGSKKAEFLAQRYGEKGFAYIGDSNADLAVWKRASHAIVVTPREAFVQRVQKYCLIQKVFMEKRSSLSLIIRAIRVHQWVKNALLFVPLIMAHEWNNIALLIQTIVAFFAFSLCASTVYIMNDLVDLESDREHPTKKNRPFASGALSLQTGFVLAPVLFIASIALALHVGGAFPLVLGVYFVVTSLYSLKLKKLVLVDIITLASLYSIRILAGAVATGVAVSQWLLAFSMFLFFSLACVKRYSELLIVRKEDRASAKGRGYVSADLEPIAQFGASSGYISILVLALYINSDEVRYLYLTPQLLWLACPLLFYWISRVWLLASRGQMHDDPIVFALRDYTSYLVGALLVFCIVISL